MQTRLRKPAIAPPPVVVAAPWMRDPTGQVRDYYRRILAERMTDLPFLNPALHVEALGFMRLDGDWLGAVVTPWCLQLMLLCGGGRLWTDIPAGERRAVALPVGNLEFIADAGEVGLPCYQYCPLIAPVSHIADMDSACRAALDALVAVLAPPPTEPAESAAPVRAPASSPGRRAFFGGRPNKR